MCGKAIFIFLKMGFNRKCCAKTRMEGKMYVLFLMPPPLGLKKIIIKKNAGIQILIHSTSTLHMVSLPMFPAGLGSTSADPSSP